MDKRLRFMSDLVGPMRVEPGYPAADPAAAELMAQARAELIAESPGQARRGMRPVPRSGG
jgi:hypothetical protein